MNKEEALEFIAQSVKSDVDMAKVADAIKVIEQDPNIRHCFGCKYSKDNHNSDTEECHLCMWENQYTPTTKNDLPHCQHTDEEIAKSFVEDVEAVKDQLPCGEQMDFPNIFDEFAEDYGFKDKDEVYTNGSELIPIFRVKQWLEHISTTKNDLGVDCISRIETIDYLCKHCPDDGECFKDCDEIKHLRQMPSVTPQPRWIPVSERLPKAGEYVGNVAKYYLVQNEYGDMLVARYTHSEYWEQMYQINPISDEIVAWMPLPKAYKEVEK